MATTEKQEQTRELTVTARYAMKTNKVLNGHVCTLVRNDQGKVHQVWTHSNGCASSCTCEGYQTWHKSCYHIRFVEAREQLRSSGQNTENTAVMVVVASTPVKPVAKREVKKTQVRTRNAKVASKQETQRRLDAPLNGNQGFSLLKKPAA